jgi:hypothetical protein
MLVVCMMGVPVDGNTNAVGESIAAGLLRGSAWRMRWKWMAPAACWVWALVAVALIHVLCHLGN